MPANCDKCIAFAVHLAAYLKVAVAKDSMTVHASKALLVKLLSGLCLHVLPFDAAIAARTQRLVELMVVMLAVGLVVHDIKVCRCERCLARRAEKT